MTEEEVDGEGRRKRKKEYHKDESANERLQPVHGLPPAEIDKRQCRRQQYATVRYGTTYATKTPMTIPPSTSLFPKCLLRLEK